MFKRTTEGVYREYRKHMFSFGGGGGAAPAPPPIVQPPPPAQQPVGAKPQKATQVPSLAGLAAAGQMSGGTTGKTLLGQ